MPDEESDESRRASIAATSVALTGGVFDILNGSEEEGLNEQGMGCRRYSVTCSRGYASLSGEQFDQNSDLSEEYDIGKDVED